MIKLTLHELCQPELPDLFLPLEPGDKLESRNPCYRSYHQKGKAVVSSWKNSGFFLEQGAGTGDGDSHPYRKWEVNIQGVASWSKASQGERTGPSEEEEIETHKEP